MWNELQVYIYSLTGEMSNPRELIKAWSFPQEPFLFNGTVGENLDPVGFCTEKQLLEAIKRYEKG